MIPVGVGVGQDDDLAVAKPRDVEVLPEAAPERRDQVGEFLVLEDLGQRGALGVQDLAAQRQDRLPRAVPALLGRPAGRIALDDEDLAVGPGRRRAVAQLAGQREAVGGGALARHLLLSGTARLAGAGGQDDPADDRLGDAPVLVQPQLERRADHRIDRGEHLGVVQPVLRLPLELRLLHEDAEHRDQAFADVLGADRHALRREVVRLDVVAHRLAEPRAEAVLVRAARAGRDPVDVALQQLVGRLGPLQHQLGAETVLLEQREGRLVDRLEAALGDDLPLELHQPFGVLERLLLAVRLVVEHHLQPLVEVARDLETLADDRRLELDLREDRRVGMEEDRRPGAARRRRAS